MGRQREKNWRHLPTKLQLYNGSTVSHRAIKQKYHSLHLYSGIIVYERPRNRSLVKLLIPADVTLFFHSSLRLLPICLRLHWLAPQPDSHKGYPSSYSDPNTRNPYPTAADSPTPWPFVMRKMSDCDLLLYLNVGEEWSLVVDFEGKYAVLVWAGESCTVKSAVGRLRDGFQWQAVEWRKHGKFELKSILGWDVQGCEVRLGILGEFNGESHIVFDSVNLGVQKPYLGHIVAASPRESRAQVMLNFSNLQDASFHERPLGDLLRKLPICSLDLLSFDALHAGIKPLVL